jgi:hypothetical protein
MERALAPFLARDLKRKIVLVSGARQCGKTTLARMIEPDHDYFNYDYAPHRLGLKERSWDRQKKLVVLDELHKMKGWKRWLKGVYDVEGIPPALLVTGSARLDAVRKRGESLAGRFFHFRLHPFDIKEARAEIDPEQAFSRLMTVGGFPEPFLENDPTYYERWKRSHLDMILRQDMIDLESVRDVSAIETLIEMLRVRVGTPVSSASLARDLERDPKTIKRWLLLLENLCVIFPVRPYHRNVARAILKEPKYYFYDTAQVQDAPGPRFENLCACALLKEVHFSADCLGQKVSLHYLRTKDGKEIDFGIFPAGRPPLLMEVKYGDEKPSSSFSHFRTFFPDARNLQLVKNLAREKTYPDGTEVRSAVKWLASFVLTEPRT